MDYLPIDGLDSIFLLVLFLSVLCALRVGSFIWEKIQMKAGFVGLGSMGRPRVLNLMKALDLADERPYQVMRPSGACLP